MHNRRPLRIATTIGPVETGLLPALEAAYSRRSALPVEHDALGTGADLTTAFQRIAHTKAPFLTRGDRSGTHVKELELWAAAGVQPGNVDWYRIAESGMAGSGATAREAASGGAYTLLDRATFVTARPGLEIMVEGDPRLLNVLSALPMNPRRAADVNEGGAEAFLNWLLAEEAQALIGDFGRSEHGTALFLRRDQIPAR
jgi:tungstate transport system substrate-binding protein